jgi:hypothetical protein
LGTAFRLDLGDDTALFSGLFQKLITLAVTILLNGFISLSIRLTWEIQRIGLMKPLTLDLEEMKEAMRQDKSSLLKHLAFQDFVELSVGSRARREEVYALSQPGENAVIGGNKRFFLLISSHQRSTYYSNIWPLRIGNRRCRCKCYR